MGFISGIFELENIEIHVASIRVCSKSLKQQQQYLGIIHKCIEYLQSQTVLLTLIYSIL